MDRLAEAEVLVAVVDAGSLTAAAERLGVSKSWVSKVIKSLEARVGVALLHRNTRHLAPTAAGEAFVERARSASELLDEAERSLSSERVAPRGMLRVSLPVSFGVRYVAPALGRFATKHPQVTIEAHYADHVVDVVAEGFDLAIRGGRLTDSELVARRLVNFSLWAAASPAYLAARGRPTLPEELVHHDVLHYSLSRDGRRISFPDHEPVLVHGPMVSNHGDALLSAACAGLGIVFQPDWMLADEVRAGRLVRLLADVRPPESAIWAVYPSSRHLSAKVTAFVEQLAAELNPAPWRAV